MSEWLETRNLCQRCYGAIDEEGKGTCFVCEDLNDKRAEWWKTTRIFIESSEQGKDAMNYGMAFSAICAKVLK